MAGFSNSSLTAREWDQQSIGQKEPTPRTRHTRPDNTSCLGVAKEPPDSNKASASLPQTWIPKRGSPLLYSTSSSLLSKFVKASRLNPYRTSSRGRRPNERRKERIGNRLGFRRERIGIRGSGAGAERGIRGGEVGAERGIEKEIRIGIGIGIERGGGAGL
ncbi:hypothetical protein ACFX2A_001902 [Malus domestica]